jgi:cephalosporin-C deacetylase-like acetyl esterase
LKRFRAIAALVFAFTIVTVAQDPWKMMDWKTETTLRSYLLQQMHCQYDVRRSSLDTVMTSVKDIEQYRKECKRRYLTLLGEMPEKTPLNPLVIARNERDGFTVENVIFESRPGHHVTANLYLPDRQGPFPAVLFFCGHEMTSKATVSYQETAILFARNGFAVMTVDPVSQGERVQFTDSAGNRLLRGSTTEHTLLDAGAILTGSSVAAWELNDNVRSLDYLLSRPEVDSSRIGCLGNSGGGVQTMYFAAFDERVKVAAPCSFITSREREYELNGTGDGCQQIPYEGKNYLEIADYLIMFSPKPMLVLAGRFDFVDYRGTVETCRETKRVYTVLGEPDRFELFTCEDGHGISEPKRIAAVRWFRKWLCNDTLAVLPDGNMTVTPEETWCTPAGQVTAMASDELTLQEHNKRAVSNLAASRREFIEKNSRVTVRSKLGELLALNNMNGDFTAETVRSESHPGYLMKKVIIRTPGEVPLPCVVLLPEKEMPADTVVIWLDHRGKSARLEDSSFISGITAGNKPVILADLRGMGETTEKPQDNDPKYYNSEYHNAVLALHTGRPLPGQRVTDILMLLDYIADDDLMKGLPVKIAATGPAALPALMAAVSDYRITALELSETPGTFAEITDRPTEKNWFSYLVPGIMKYFDIPDMAGMRPDLKIKYVNR